MFYKLENSVISITISDKIDIHLPLSIGNLMRIKKQMDLAENFLDFQIGLITKKRYPRINWVSRMGYLWENISSLPSF